MIDDLVEELLHVDPTYQEDIDFFCLKYQCVLEVAIFKSKDLQYEYEYEITFTKNIAIHIIIESGIDSGTVLRMFNFSSTSNSDDLQNYLLVVSRENKINELLNQ